MLFSAIEKEHPVFIVGSPRSGTTILGRVLDLHPDLKQWFEPYFVWDKYFRLSTDDARTSEDATAKVIKEIRSSFRRYQRKAGCQFVLDKSPRNSLRIDFIRQVFPEARFIHICRDGRDSTLSINKEWLKRKNQETIPFYRAMSSHIKQWSLFFKGVQMQPFMRDRIWAIWFETHGHFFNKDKWLSRLRWNGAFGWGPRFTGWESSFNTLSLLQFNALQWHTCVSSVLDSWNRIPDDLKLFIRYEDFIQKPVDTFKHILEFIGMDYDPTLSKSIPAIRKDNFNKWQIAFSKTQIEEIRPILTPNLLRLGYIKNSKW
jgi:hypothetical protein